MAEKAPDIRLEVAGKLYGGWTSIEIRRGIEQCAGTFNFALTDRWPGQNEMRLIRAGSPCRVLIDSEPVITGYVDDVEISWAASSHDYQTRRKTSPFRGRI